MCRSVLWSRDERECFFHSHSLTFPTVHSHSRSQAQRGFIIVPVLFVISILSRSHSYTSISSHLLLFFMYVIKQTTGKFKNNCKSNLKYTSLKLGQFCPILVEFGLVSCCMLCGKWEMHCFHSVSFLLCHSRALSHSPGTKVIFPVPMGIPDIDSSLLCIWL